MLKFGILSTAKIGYEQLVPAIQQADNCVVQAVASRTLAKAKRFANTFGIPESFGSYEDMIASDSIDAVYIPLPTSQHIEWSIAAAKAGKHVLCEKPISLNASDIKPLIKARDKHKVVVSEAFMVTYHPQWHKVRELLKKGAIGKLRQVEASFTYHNVDPKNMRNRVELGGGVIPDIGVYPTVATRFATGLEPKRLQATVEFDPKFKTDRYANVRADFGSFQMNFYLSTQLSNRQTCVFHGDKGFIELSAPFNSNLYEGDEVRLHNKTHDEASIFRFTGINQYRLQVEAFSNACQSKSKAKNQALFSLEESIKNQKVIDAIYKADKSGKWEKI